MRRVDLFGSAVAGYLAVSAVRLSLGTRATVAELTGRPAPPPPDPARVPRIVVLLPMLREQAGVRDACRRFAAAVADRPNVEIVLITSRSEQRRPTTAEVAAPVLAELDAAAGRPLFRHVDAPGSAGTKVAKLNLAVAGIAPDPGRETYVGVYDADSDPDPRVLDWVEAETARPGRRPPAVYQQVSCYCRNLATLSGGRGVLALADALAQTRWALGFEYPLYARYSRAVRAGTLRPLAYCVGHGCFVSLSFLDRIGGFPTRSATDDLALGYVASALGAEIAPVPALDYCEVAPDPVRSVRQSRFWFSGSARFWRDLRHAQRDLGARPTPAQRVALHLDGAGRNAAWAGRGPAWVLALALAAGHRRTGVAGALVAAHLLYVQAGYLQSLRALRALPAAAAHTDLARLPRWRLVAGAGAASAVFVLRSLGPFLGALDGSHRRRTRTWKAER